MRRLTLGLLFTLLATLFWGCETPGGRASPGATSGGAPRLPAWASLERTEEGRSLYVVTLFEDGRAMFEGAVGGRRRTLTKPVDAGQAARVFQMVEAIDLWNRQPRYDVEHARQGNDSVVVRTASPDEPWDILRVQRQGRTKRIDGLFFAPRDILELKSLIEETVGLKDWLAQARAVTP